MVAEEEKDGEGEIGEVEQRQTERTEEIVTEAD